MRGETDCRLAEAELFGVLFVAEAEAEAELFGVLFVAEAVAELFGVLFVAEAVAELFLLTRRRMSHHTS